MNDSTQIDGPSPAFRSAVTNGSALFLEDVDGRSRQARRFRDILASLVSDLGGLESLSEQQRQLARRGAFLSLQCELLEGKAVAGEDIDLDLFGTLVDRQGRTFQRLGIKRVPRDVTGLGQILSAGVRG